MWVPPTLRPGDVINADHSAPPTGLRSHAGLYTWRTPVLRWHRGTVVRGLIAPFAGESRATAGAGAQAGPMWPLGLSCRLLDKVACVQVVRARSTRGCRYTSSYGRPVEVRALRKQRRATAEAPSPRQLTTRASQPASHGEVKAGWSCLEKLRSALRIISTLSV